MRDKGTQLFSERKHFKVQHFGSPQAKSKENQTKANKESKISHRIRKFAKNQKNATFMTNSVKNLVLRAFCLLVLGVILLVYSNSIAGAIVQAIGALLIVPGLFSIGSLFRAKKSQGEVALSLILGSATIILGTILLIWPSMFISALMYTLAGLLILAGTAQFTSRWQMQKQGIKLDKLSYFVPVLTLLAGIVVIAFPLETASIPFCIIGAAFCLYSILEFISAWQIRKFQKTHTHSTIIVDEAEETKTGIEDQLEA